MKIYFESYGCTLNRAEAGLYVNRMLEQGNELVSGPEEADLSIIGTCVVIKHTEDRMMKRIQELSSLSRVRVTGCLPPVSGGSLESENVEVIKPREIRSFYQGYLDDVEIREPSVFEGIPINQGCTGSCNYCISHMARGKLVSRPVQKIVNQARMQIARGIMEVRISSLDTAAYGRDLGIRLPELVDAITGIPSDFRLRIGMMEPRNTMDIIDHLMRSMGSEKVFRFLHVPVQSGDDRILDLMNREYHAHEFRHISEMFRQNFPDSTLSTDIITGYHDEDENSHELTMKLLQEVRPEIVNITRFSPRPYTPDFGSTVPPSNTVKRRARELTDLHHEIIQERLASLHGRTETAMVTEKGRNSTVVARDGAYRPVVIKGEYPLYSWVNVEIVDSGPTYLAGKIIS
jgi:MiaB-like tRNA modifying enzyme